MRTRVLVDLTPLGPGGQNGGAGLVATSLVRHIGRLAPEWELVVLTSILSHAELGELDAANVRRVCTSQPADDTASVTRKTVGLKRVVRTGLQLFPPEVRVRAKDFAWRMRHSKRHASLLAELDPDLLFCPMTVPYFWRHGVPLVAIVYDLQHLAFPEFFSDEQRLNRTQHFHEVADRAERVVCISDFVRETMRKHIGIDENRLVTIYPGLLQEFESHPGAEDILDEHNLRAGTYLLYPANFWPHKNHRRLFDALALHRRGAHGRAVKLVCTGATNGAMLDLQHYADSVLGPGVAVFTGYLATTQLQVLLSHCSALIYPSLYEGFGMPVLEAMAYGKPVLCSTAGSLPEVAGSAARYFDPTDTVDIERAIASLNDDPVGTRERGRNGRVRATTFGSAEDMARKYIEVFEQVVCRA